MADTNVLVSAAVAPAGVCGALIAAAAAGEWKLVVSPLLLEELTGVLGRPKFAKLPTGAVERFVAALGAVAEVVPDAPRPWDRVSVDPDDDYLVALAQRARVDALVSGDPDLTALTGVRPPVQTPAAFWARVQAGRPGTREARRSSSRP